MNVRLRLTFLVLPALAGPPAYASPESPPTPPQPLVTVRAVDGVPWGNWGADLFVSSCVSAAVWGLYSFAGSRLQAESPHTGAVLTSLTVATAVLAPALTLNVWRTPEFPLDDFIAAATGGVLGIGASYAIIRGFSAGQSLEPLAWALAVGGGQGIGTSLAYHAYRDTKPQLKNLNQLPVRREDDPIDNWRFWQERRTP